RRPLDVRVDAVAIVIVDGPAWSPRQRQLCEHAHRVELDNGGGAAFAEWFAEVEAVQPTSAAVVGESVRVRPHVDLAEQLLIRAAEDADARGGSVARKKQVVFLIDEDAGDARQLGGEGVQVSARLAVEHLDPIGAGVSDIHPSAAWKDIRVIEPWFCALRDRYEAGADEAHAFSAGRPTTIAAPAIAPAAAAVAPLTNPCSRGWRSKRRNSRPGTTTNR